MTAAARLRELARYQKAAAPDEVAWVMAHTGIAAVADEVERLEERLATCQAALREGEDLLARSEDEVERLEAVREAMGRVEADLYEKADFAGGDVAAAYNDAYQMVRLALRAALAETEESASRGNRPETP